MKNKGRILTAVEMYKAQKLGNIQQKAQNKKEKKKKSNFVSYKGKLLNKQSNENIKSNIIKNMSLLTKDQLSLITKEIPSSIVQDGRKKKKKKKKRIQMNETSNDQMKIPIKPDTEKRPGSPLQETKKKKTQKNKIKTNNNKPTKIVNTENQILCEKNSKENEIKYTDESGKEIKKQKFKNKENSQTNQPTSLENLGNSVAPVENNMKNEVNVTVGKKIEVTNGGIEVIDETLNNFSDSKSDSLEAFKWMIYPIKTNIFFKKHWEKEPLYIHREKKDYYKGVFSTADLDKILREQFVQFTKNLNITSYSDGKRETHDPEGRAHAPVVWDYYNNGCSVRMLNPQTFHKGTWKLLSTLQEYFNSFCGANVYLTPPGTQGFAPHWDDIEAFILQLEGKKHWKVYKPRTPEEVLPENSSGNLDANETGEVYLDVILEPGDMLYFPRGWIHQGFALEDIHSLHITVSTYQKNSWGTYLSKLLPHALSVAMEENVEFRKGLPRDYLNYMGIVHSEKDEQKDRKVFAEKVSELVKQMIVNAPYDAAADQMGINFIHDCLPPFLTADDKECSIYGGGECWSKIKKKVINRTELEPDTNIRLIRGNCIRVVAEQEVVRVYHTLENSREYHATEPQFVELSPEHAPAVECLVDQYPNFITIEELPLETEEEKMAFASGLWERGIVMTDEPLVSQYDD